MSKINCVKYTEVLIKLRKENIKSFFKQLISSSLDPKKFTTSKGFRHTVVKAESKNSIHI